MLQGQHHVCQEGPDNHHLVVSPGTSEVVILVPIIIALKAPTLSFTHQVAVIYVYEK